MKPRGDENHFMFGPHEDRDFFLSLMGSIAFYGALVLLIQFIQIQERPREDLTRIPPQVAKLILEVPPSVTRPKIPPPVPRAEDQERTEAPQAPPQEPATPRDQKTEQPQPPAASEKQARAPREDAAAREQEAIARRQRNREVAMQSGLLRILTQKDQNRSTVEESTQDDALQKMRSRTSPIRRLEAAPPGQSLAEDARRDSENGIGIENVMAMLKAQEPGSIAGGGIESRGERRTARIESPIEIQAPGGGQASRSYESIQETVDSLKGWIRFVYNRALRQNPTLKGTITLEFDIAPTGEVTECRVASSTLNHPELEAQLVKRFLKLQFPPISQGIHTVIYPVTLIPSG